MLQDPLQKERGRRKRGCREGERKRGREKGSDNCVVGFHSPSYLVNFTVSTRPICIPSVLISPTSTAFVTIHNVLRALGCSFLSVLNVLCDLGQSEIRGNPEFQLLLTKSHKLVFPSSPYIRCIA